MRGRAFACLLALCAGVSAQRAAPNRWPVESIAVEGNRNYTQQQILAVAGLKMGQFAGKEDFEAARERLEQTGAFETVGYRFEPSSSGKGYAASFQVVEVETVYPVRFDNLGVPAEEVADHLKKRDPLFGPKVPGAKPALERYAREIEQFLASRNLKHKVAARVMPSASGDLSIVFRLDRPDPVVAEVTFEGNEALASDKLNTAIYGVAYGVPYTEKGFRELLESAIRPLYEHLGRLRVAFPKITTEKAEHVEGLAVHVTVDEGPVYELEAVEIHGAPSVKRADLLKVAALKTGEPADFTEIQQAVERLKRSFRRNGFMNVQASLDRKLDDKKKTVALAIELNEGPQYTFGRLAIEGLDLHGEAAVKKLWALKAGQPFNADYPNYFLAKVREEGIFDELGKTASKLNVNEESKIVDVTLNFGAAPPEPGERGPGQRRRRR